METILNYYANTNAEYIHSKGKTASAILLEYLDCKPNETILEFGFGTAATLVDFASIHKKAAFFGVETNENMYKKGLNRIKFCSLKNINIILNSNASILPYPDNFFDKVYAESVLAIQEGDNLQAIIGEIYRVLKPNSPLIINEGIWIDIISQERKN
jgi:ubiquinone/menaquinone biosynthesis C-methylase UbiE